MGRMFLLVIDVYTKWLEVHVTTTTSSAVTTDLLRKSFSIFELPEVVVSDNAANFTNEEFQAFMKSNGVKHVQTAPYHPASNGMVEHAIQTLKDGLKKLRIGSIEMKLSHFLFAYSVTPHSSTGTSPVELMNHRLHSPMGNLRPNLDKRMQHGQEQQKRMYDTRARVSEVYARNYGPGAKW